MSFTVWSYDYDAAPHHANNLNDDTVRTIEEAADLARKRAAETSQNTGYAIVVDSDRCRMGDRGIVATLKKDKNGRVYVKDVRPELITKFLKRTVTVG